MALRVCASLDGHTRTHPALPPSKSHVVRCQCRGLAKGLAFAACERTSHARRIRTGSWPPSQPERAPWRDVVGRCVFLALKGRRALNRGRGGRRGWRCTVQSLRITRCGIAEAFHSRPVLKGSDCRRHRTTQRCVARSLYREGCHLAGNAATRHLPSVARRHSGHPHSGFRSYRELPLSDGRMCQCVAGGLQPDSTPPLPTDHARRAA